MTELNNFLQDTLFFIPNWKWIALLLTFFSGYLIRSLAAQFLARANKKLIHIEKTRGVLKHFLDQPIETPLSWIITLVFWSFSIEAIELSLGITKFIRTGLHIGVVFHCIRITYMGVDAMGRSMQEIVLKNNTTIDEQLTRFATQTLKVIVVILGVLIAMQNFGIDVSTLIASLGLGGLAFALAAQETVSNFFGSVMIILDKPFKKGDHVRVGDTEGIIEEVGFRSTRIRTMYDSLVTIPNSTMAKEKIDNLGVRSKRRIRHIIGIEYSTPIEKIESFADAIRQSLIQRDDIFRDQITVSLNNLGDFNIQILVCCFVPGNNPDEEMLTQQEILIQIMKIAKNMHVEFAFPTQTVHVKNH